MPTLADRLVEVGFGRRRAPDGVRVALVLNGQEVVDAGVRAVFVPLAEWTVSGGTALTLVEFGPFATRQVVDGASVTYDGASCVGLLPEPVTVLAGMRYVHEAILNG